MNQHKPFLAAFFRMVVTYPRITLAVGLVLIGTTASGLLHLYKDTSVDAFVPADHPSLLANDRMEEVFGMTDPIAVAVLSRDGSSIFRPEPPPMTNPIRTEPVPSHCMSSARI